MADADEEFDKAFEGFGEDPKPTPPVTPPADPATPPATPPVVIEPPKVDAPKPPEEPKKDEPATPPAEPPKKDEATPPAANEEKPKEDGEPATPPAAPPAPEEAKPLTKDDVTSIIQNIRTDERASSKELENTTKEVLEAYYPDGLSNTLTDQASGKELKTPQDVVDASNGEMTTEQAAQWLMNEQYKLDAEVTRIKDDAKKIAETTVNFKRDAVSAVQKYEPLFKAYPALQAKVFDQLMKQVKADNKKGVILSAPDVMEHYDFYLEPYQKAFEFSTQQSATNPVPAPADTPPPAPKPGADDRLDEGGDGGVTVPDDPNDFAQQVGKELAKGI